MWHYEIGQSQHCINENNDHVDNAMCANVWTNSIVYYFNVKNVIYEREIWQQEARFKLSTSIPHILRYNKGRDITEGDIAEFRV